MGSERVRFSGKTGSGRRIDLNQIDKKHWPCAWVGNRADRLRTPRYGLCTPVVDQMLEHRPPERQHESPSRTCECGNQMTYLGDLPQSRGKPGIHIFRCYDCNNVVSEPKIGRISKTTDT
jgi:hypothetical protein